MLKALEIEPGSGEFWSLPIREQWLVRALHETYAAWCNVQDALAEEPHLSDDLHMQTMRAALNLWDGMKALDATITTAQTA